MAGLGASIEISSVPPSQYGVQNVSLSSVPKVPPSPNIVEVSTYCELGLTLRDIDLNDKSQIIVDDLVLFVTGSRSVIFTLTVYIVKTALGICPNVRIERYPPAFPFSPFRFAGQSRFSFTPDTATHQGRARFARYRFSEG